MLMRIPQAGRQGLAGPIDDLGPDGRRSAGRGSDRGDQTLIDNDRLILGEVGPVLEGANMGEGDRPGGGFKQGPDEAWRTLRQSLVLGLLHPRLVGLIAC